MQAYLQDEAEVSRGLVFVFKVFPVVDVYVIELDKADEVTGWLKRKKELHNLFIVSSFLFLLSCQQSRIATLQMQMMGIVHCMDGMFGSGSCQEIQDT